MKISAMMPVLIALLPLRSLAQDTCALTIDGQVRDAITHAALPFAFVTLEPTGHGGEADAMGQYKLSHLCKRQYTLICSYVGYKTDTVTILLTADRIRDFELYPAVTTIGEVEVTGKKEDHTTTISQYRTEIRGETLLQSRGGSLGEALRDVPGVYTLQSGPSIFKPVIHGLHSNRILLFNNGVRQEGQQWGSEHAPEIDPFVATKLTVIRGASGIRYGSDAIGGVILVEPASMPHKKGISGELNVVGASNNGMGVTSGILQGAFAHALTGLSWRVQGTYRRAGNSRTPHYYLENTGFQEANFSGAMQYTRHHYGGAAYYSQFNTKLGIFTGTHAETVSDLEAAISRAEPLTQSYFSYKIDRPYQQVQHDLFKGSAYYLFNNASRIDVVFARQQNIRSEYDFVPLSGRLNPELYLRLTTHTTDAIYQHKPSGGYTGVLGFNGITQGNVRQYQMLIPNFRNYGGGVFYIGKWTSDRLAVEGGARYDYRWLRVYTLDNNTAQIVTPTWKYSNYTGTLGTSYYLTPALSWLVNLGTSWRAPTVNELMSQGVHQSAVAYEIGNPNLHSEKAYNASTSIHYRQGRLQGEVGLYENLINGYIYLKPDLQFIHTIRGSYPTFTYTQVDARFRGLDLSMSYDVLDSLRFTSKVSLLYAWNKTIHDYLQLIPSNRIENGMRFGFGNVGKVKQVYAGMTSVFVAQQKRVPLNSDYAPPPPAYALLNATVGISVPCGKRMMTVTVAANNVLNVAYRDYMDRFRYFADEPGRSFTVRTRLVF